MFYAVVVTDDQRKLECLEYCENTLSVLNRDNADSILDKMLKYAVFIEAKDDSGTVGYCSMYANDTITRKAYITFICIKKEKQGMKYGKRLLEESISEAKRRGMTSVRLEVKNTNTKAIALYTSCGFTYEGESSKESSYYTKDL